VISIAASVVLSTFNTPLGIRLFSVQSGSMEPAIPVGSLVMVRPQDSYTEGEIITVRSERSAKETVTHRIVERAEDKDIGSVSYKLKGDANEDPDPEMVPEKRVVGKVVLHIPFLGYPVGFAQSQIGFVILIIIPATIIVYSELMVIKKEFLKFFTRKKSKKNKEEKDEND